MYDYCELVTRMLGRLSLYGTLQEKLAAHRIAKQILEQLNREEVPEYPETDVWSDIQDLLDELRLNPFLDDERQVREILNLIEDLLAEQFQEKKPQLLKKGMVGKPARYTFADLFPLPEEERYEIIRDRLVPNIAGKAALSGAFTALLFQFANLLGGRRKNGRYELLQFPFAVLPFADTDYAPADVDTVLLPMLELLDPSRLTEYACAGAPALVVEISEADTADLIRTDKMDIYEEAGVLEYWILDLEKRRLTVFLSESGMFTRMRVYTGETKVPVTVLDGAEIDLGEVLNEAFDLLDSREAQSADDSDKNS